MPWQLRLMLLPTYGYLLSGHVLWVRLKLGSSLQIAPPLDSVLVPSPLSRHLLCPPLRCTSFLPRPAYIVPILIGP